MENLCPICQKSLKMDPHLYFNISCEVGGDHFYAVSTSRSGTKAELRFRIDKICVVLRYVDKNTKIWLDYSSNDNPNQDKLIATINDIIKIDFSDLPKLKEKLQKYIIFS